jgi:hypothetical protein
MLSALVAGLFVWMAEKQGGAQMSGTPGTTDSSGRGGEKYRMNMIILASRAHAPDENAGVTENFLRWLPHLTDGDVQPLWPWAMSGLVDGDQRAAGLEPEKDRQLLRGVRSVQVWMGAGFLMLCGLMAARSLHPGAVLPALLPGALLALLAYGTDFGPAGMNYMMVFLSWVCALRLLHRNSVWLHGVFGVLTGLAWLTDVTSLFVVAAWLAAATARWGWTSLRRGEQALHEPWIARNHFVGLVALVLGWISVCGPRCGAAMDHWGRPLFSWQQYWMWMDSNEEALAVVDRYEDVRAMESGRRMDLPGWSDYWKIHTTEQAKDRLVDGANQIGRQFLGMEPGGATSGLSGKLPPSRQGAWLTAAAGLFVIAGLVAVAHRRQLGSENVKAPSGSVAAVLFVVVAGSAYAVWYAWYTPIKSDPRLPMVLYMPLVWSLVWGAEKLVTMARTCGASSGIWLGWRILLWAVTAAMAADLYLLLQGTDVMQFGAL